MPTYTDRGNFDINATYNERDVVHYNGSLYYCKINNTTGILPTATSNWCTMAKVGVVGYSDRGNYDATATYNKWNVVHYNNSLYYCKVDNTTGILPTTVANWGNMVKCYEPDGETIFVNEDGKLEGAPNALPDNHTILKDGNDIISVNEVYASTKAQLEQAMASLPDGALGYTPEPTATDLNEAINESWSAHNRIFEGRDLTVIFASEIANYTDEWAWIQARLNAHDVSGLRVGDYIPINIAANGGIDAETHKAEIAGINTYRRTGDSSHEVGYHFDWITHDCYSGTVQFNTSNNNNGNATNSNPFLASNLKSWLDGTLYPLLETKLKNVIKTKRILAPSRYQSGATLTDDNSWGWQDFDKLWVPLEGEIFDSLVWSTKGFGNGQAVQYPIFANSYEHRIKGVGPGGARAYWWTASARSGYSTYVVNVGKYGYSDISYASGANLVPVCFRTMEDTE